MSSSEKILKTHRELYKARTPPWKETYRKRCFERLRQSRDKLQSRFRNIGKEAVQTEDGSFIKDLMTEEWKNLQREKSESSPVKEDDFETEDFDPYSIDEMLSLFEDIQQELKIEEAKLLKEFDCFEHSLHTAEAALCSAIDKLCTDEVVCPVCQKHPLMKNKNVIFCGCGLRIDTEQDCLTLSNVKQLLEEGIHQHASLCEVDPAFSMVEGMGHANLLMTCQICDWMFIVI